MRARVAARAICYKKRAYALAVLPYGVAGVTRRVALLLVLVLCCIQLPH